MGTYGSAIINGDTARAAWRSEALDFGRFIHLGRITFWRRDIDSILDFVINVTNGACRLWPASASTALLNVARYLRSACPRRID